MTDKNAEPATAPRVDSTLSKGLAILENLAATRGGKGVSDIARDLGLTKSNAFRLLQTLSALGFVRQDPDKTYRATLKTWQVGRAVVENLNLRQVATPLMQYLWTETGETIYLAVREGLHVVYIDKLESRKPIRSWNPIGGSAPIHATGTGKAMLAADYARLRPLLPGNLTRYTDETLTAMPDLDRDIEVTRTRGFAVDQGEFRERIYSIGAAISLPDGSLAGAVGVSVPDVNLPEDGADRIGALVMHAARSISEKLAQI